MRARRKGGYRGKMRFKVSTAKGWRFFADYDAAVEMASKVFRETGVVVAVERVGRERDVFTRNRMKVARDTMRMPDAMAGVMGGMTKAEAERIVNRRDND